MDQFIPSPRKTQKADVQSGEKSPSVTTPRSCGKGRTVTPKGKTASGKGQDASESDFQVQEEM